MSKKESCDAKYILQNLDVIKEDKNKITYIKDTLNRCSSKPTERKKRKMSGYNCFIRVSTKKGQPYKEVIKSGAWKQLNEKDKDTWSHLAEDGCPPRLWE